MQPTQAKLIAILQNFLKAFVMLIDRLKKVTVDTKWLTVFLVFLFSVAYAEDIPVTIAATSANPKVNVFYTVVPANLWGVFQVKVKIKNISKNNLTLPLIPCEDFFKWKTDNAALEVYKPTPCNKNAPKFFILKAGEAVSLTVPVAVVGRISEPSLKFRVGFTLATTQQSYWSDEINLSVHSLSVEEWRQRDASLRDWQKNLPKGEGIYKIYYFNGFLVGEASFKQGKLNGLSKSYSIEGKLLEESYYVNGEIEGLSTLYDVTQRDSTKKSNEILYHNGTVVTLTNYHSDGSVSYLLKNTIKQQNGKYKVIATCIEQIADPQSGIAKIFSLCKP